MVPARKTGPSKELHCCRVLARKIGHAKEQLLHGSRTQQTKAVTCKGIVALHALLPGPGKEKYIGHAKEQMRCTAERSQ